MRTFARLFKFCSTTSFGGKTLFGVAAGASLASFATHQLNTAAGSGGQDQLFDHQQQKFTFDPQHDSKSSFADNKHLTKVPEAKIIRKIPSLIGDDTSRLDLRLYQFQNCPFCCKVRAVLDYYGFGYEVVEVNSVTKKEIKFSEYKKVPIVLAKGWNFKQLNDSSFIISFLRTYFVDPERPLDEIKSYYPIFVYQPDSDDDKKKAVDLVYENDNKYFVMFNEKLKDSVDIGSRREEREWRQWVDKKFVHTISPNIYRSFRESINTFEWFSVNGEWSSAFPVYERLFIQYVGALVMYFVGKKLKNKHDLKNDVRESLYDACNEWTAAIGQHRKYMGGNRPNLADLAMYGALISFEGCQAFNDALGNTNIGPWFEATKSAVEARLGADEFGRV